MKTFTKSVLMLAVVAHSFLSLLAVTPVPRKPLRILSPLQKLLIRSHRLRLLPLPPLLLFDRC